MNECECRAAGVDMVKMERLERMLNKAGRMAEEMGVTIFGGAGTGSLRKRKDDDGLLRGE